MNKPHAHIYSAEINKWIAGTLKLPTYWQPRSTHRATKEIELGRLATTNLPLLSISLQTIERVTSFKLLGVHLDTSLSSSTHINHIIKKATRLYFLKQLKRAGLSNSHLLHFYITVIRPVLEYCAPLWHYALTKTQPESLEAVQKRAIRSIHILTHGMPYSSMLLYANLSSLASRREDLSCSFFFCDIMDTAFCLHSLLPHLDRRLSPQALDPPKPFQKFILVRSATAPSYNMVLIISSIKSIKPSFPTTPYI